MVSPGSWAWNPGSWLLVTATPMVMLRILLYTQESIHGNIELELMTCLVTKIKNWKDKFLNWKELISLSNTT